MLYSIAGETYGVYSDKDCTKQLATLTRDNSRNTDTVEVKAGAVYIKELSAPAGYKVDNTVYFLNVEAGKREPTTLLWCFQQKLVRSVSNMSRKSSS